MKYYIVYILLLFLSLKNTLSQDVVDSIYLPEIFLHKSKLTNHSIGTHIDIINEKLIGNSFSNSMSDLLERNTSFYVKRYGALSTPAFRGTSSSHTLLIWNGVPINSISNGLIDFSNIPINNLHETKIVHGSDGSVFGSGAIGGSIHFDSKNVFENIKNTILTYEIGSYGLSSKSIVARKANSKLSINAVIQNLTDENNFVFVNTSQMGSPLDTNDYGKIISNQCQFNLSYKITSSLVFMFNYWGTNNDREVSQNMTINNSDAKQYDIIDRLLFSTFYKLNNFQVNFKYASINEIFNYTEVSKNIDSYYNTSSRITDLDLKFNMDHLFFNSGVIYTNNFLFNNNYLINDLNENQLALFSAFQFKSKYFNFNSVIRKEFNENYNVPLLPTIALENGIGNIRIRSKYNHSFRAPTFNDRYWFSNGSQGNPNLKSEFSRNIELGIDYCVSNISFSLTAFNMLINDMIIWQSIEGGIWMPYNVKEVYSRGFETKLELSIDKLSFEGNYAFIKSTNHNQVNPLDESIGKQLLYVPKHKTNITAFLSILNFIFIINQSFTDRVIISYGSYDDKYLDSFFLTDFSVVYEFQNLGLDFSLNMKNALNVSYQTYSNYPNPGRELHLILSYKI